MPMDRIQSLGLVLFLFLLTGQSSADADGLAREPRPGSWKADASLTDVTFLDRQHGWAVGSQGVLLRTEDGGKTWGEGNLASSNQKLREASLTEKIQRIRANQQMGIADGSDAANFSSRFESVCFTDANNGWAAGGYDLPWLDHSRAVIARTLDGGKSWQSLPQLMVGRIHKIEFRGMERLSGWAVGASDPATNASLSFTSDAGNIWSSQKSEQMPDLIDAETAGNRFVGIDSNGQPVHFDATSLEHAVIMGDVDPVLSDLLMIDNKNGFAVGHNGVFMATNNVGLSWSSVGENELLKTFDFRCIHATQDRIWFAGNPGHVLFSYDRSSKQINSHPLHGATAINAIHFVDPQFGWAVGDLGQIWNTTDGGENWSLQRSGSPQGQSKLGVLAVCDSVEDDVPLEFFARHAGEDGKLVGALVPQNGKVDSIRLATERVGVSVVAPIVFKPNDKNTLLRKTVRSIRHWRPTVIVGTDRAFLEKAVRIAAHEDSLKQQLAAGLKTWQPRYLMVSDPNGPIKYEDSIFLPRVGSLLDDFVMPSRMVCGLPIQSDNKTAFFAWKFDGSGTDIRLVEIEGSPFSKETVAKRQKESVALGSLSSVKRASHKREQFRWLLDQNIESVLDAEECKRRISQLAYQLDATPNGKNVAGIWLTQLADKLIAAGKHQQAAFALETLARGYPKHALAPLASLTLAKYYSSAEFNRQSLNEWKKLRGSFGQATRIPAGTRSGPQNVAIQQSNPGQGVTEYRWNKVDLASALEDAAALPLDFDVEEELKNFDPETVDLSLDIEEPETDDTVVERKAVPMTDMERGVFLRQRLRNAASEFSRLANRDPGLAKRTDLLYLQAHIVERLGGSDEAKPYFQNVVKSRLNPKFVMAASEELRRDTYQLSDLVSTSQRPHLDGLPNDAVWQQVMKAKKSINLGTIDSGVRTDVAMLAWGEEYLYVYARCYKAGSRRYQQRSDEPRRRDGDLSHHHRVEFSIDVDRDLSSFWKIAVDWRGHVCESCGSDKSWNPKMFVARHIDENIWSVECAIPTKELVDRIGPDSAWRVKVRRVMEPEKLSSGFWGPCENLANAVPDELVSFGLKVEESD
jgi:photosystem II stability/assembly factor-like uncharacterized protein/tetratricopeptide (TPR) repeat protein